MNEYGKIKEIRNKIRDLSLILGDLVSVLEGELVDDKAKEVIEEQAWKLVEKIHEVISKDYRENEISKE